MSKQLNTIPQVGQIVSIQGDLMPAFNTRVWYVGKDEEERNGIKFKNRIFVEYNCDDQDEFAVKPENLPLKLAGSGHKFLAVLPEHIYEPDGDLIDLYENAVCPRPE